MNNKCNELTRNHAQSLTRGTAIHRAGLGLAGMALACFGLIQDAVAQTSVVCDVAGDAGVGHGQAKGSPVPLWLDIQQAAVTDDSEGNIFFTLTVNAPIPTIPTWSKIEEGGQLTWSWRLVSDLAGLTVVRNGCFGANGSAIPACYFLDFIWSVQDSTFRARLLDNTSCTEVVVPYALSPDRTQIILVVAKNLLSNRSLIAEPNNFQFLTSIVAWDSNGVGNSSYHHLDWAPDLNEGQLVLCSWSASVDSTCSCQVIQKTN